MKHQIIAFLMVALLAPGDLHAEATEGIRVVLSPTGAGQDARGEIVLSEGSDAIHLKGSISGLSKGRYGFHVHEKGSCAQRGEAAGPHFNPSGKPHGAPDAAERHAGDLGNIEASGTGSTTIDVHDKALKSVKLEGLKGKSIVVHEGPDDLKSQPSGNAGARISCGVIQ